MLKERIKETNMFNVMNPGLFNIYWLFTTATGVLCQAELEFGRRDCVWVCLRRQSFNRAVTSDLRPGESRLPLMLPGSSSSRNGRLILLGDKHVGGLSQGPMSGQETVCPEDCVLWITASRRCYWNGKLGLILVARDSHGAITTRDYWLYW